MSRGIDEIALPAAFGEGQLVYACACICMRMYEKLVYACAWRTLSRHSSAHAMHLYTCTYINAPVDMCLYTCTSSRHSSVYAMCIGMCTCVGVCVHVCMCTPHHGIHRHVPCAGEKAGNGVSMLAAINEYSAVLLVQLLRLLDTDPPVREW